MKCVDGRKWRRLRQRQRENTQKIGENICWVLVLGRNFISNTHTHLVTYIPKIKRQSQFSFGWVSILIFEWFNAIFWWIQKYQNRFN